MIKFKVKELTPAEVQALCDKYIENCAASWAFSGSFIYGGKAYSSAMREAAKGRFYEAYSRGEILE